MSLVIYLGVHAFHAEPEEALQRQYTSVVPISQVRDIRPRQTTYSVLKNMTQATAGQLQQWLGQGDIEHCTLAYPLPMPYIAALMAKGVSPDTAVNQWHGQAERLIRLFKKNRRGISLMAYPQAEQLETSAGEVINTPVPLPHIAPIYQLAAQHLMQQSPDLEKTQAYLLACTQNAGEAKPAPVPNVTEAIEQHRRLRSENHAALKRLETYENRHRNLAGEYQATEQQLQRLQGDLDNQVIQLQQAKQHVRELEEALKKKEAGHQTALTKQQQLLNEENTLMLEQLHSVQEELEQFIMNNSCLKRDLSRSRHEKQVLAKKLTVQQTIAEWLRTCAAKAVKEATKNNSIFKKRLARHKQLLENSPLFDAEWYQAQYPDVANGSMDAVEHYLKYGALEGRNPSSHFDTLHYIATYPDVAAAGLNPLIHFIELGQTENRQPLPALELS